ncbi:hypothetical protein AB6O49_31780 [Streptomyces sp. SBR177]
MGAIAAVPLLGLVNDRLGGVALLVALVLLWWRNPWPRAGRIVATVAAMALLGAVLPDQPRDTPGRAANAGAAKPPAGPGGSPTPSRATPEATMPALPDFTGDSLDLAFPKSRRKGFTVLQHDASDQGREVTGRSLWKVCFQVTGGSPEEPIVDFGVVRREEPCPAAEGATVPWPKMPDVVGLTWRAAVPKVTAAGVPEEDVRAEAAYLNDRLPEEGEYEDWRVCRQDPASGDPSPTTSTPCASPSPPPPTAAPPRTAAGTPTCPTATTTATRTTSTRIPATATARACSRTESRTPRAAAPAARAAATATAGTSAATRGGADRASGLGPRRARRNLPDRA